jgi:hypothetical protein
LLLNQAGQNLRSKLSQSRLDVAAAKAACGTRALQDRLLSLSGHCLELWAALDHLDRRLLRLWTV